MANNANVSVKIIKMPMELDEQGNPKNLDFTTLAKHLNASELPPEVNSDPQEFPEVPTPKEIYRQASRYVLHQPNALKELATVFFYHLQSQKNHHEHHHDTHKQDYLEQLNSAFGLDEKFLKELDKMDDKTVQELNEYEKAKQAGQEPPKPPRPKFTSTAPIFLTGKTGSGKTHMIKQLCKLFDVNFIAINTPSISNAGYKGVTLADIGASLLQSSNGNRAKALHSVVFFDEFDKLFINDGLQLGAYHLSLMTEILTIIEGTTPFPIKDDSGMDSSHMLFILGGSFNIHQRNEKTPIGFMNEKTLQDTPDNQMKLADFGLPDELAGRIGRIISLDEIDYGQMVSILLDSPTSPFVAFKNQLAMVDCTAYIEGEVLDKLAVENEPAIDKFGVRGLYQAFNRLPQIGEILYEAPEHIGSHYVITLDGFERQEPPKPKEPADYIYDDLPF